MSAVTDDRWTDAPIDPSAHWAHEAAQLRAHPGRWRDVRYCNDPESAKYMARDVRNGALAAFRPAGAYEACSRGAVVKARYIATTTEEN